MWVRSLGLSWISLSARMRLLLPLGATRIAALVVPKARIALDLLAVHVVHAGLEVDVQVAPAVVVVHGLGDRDVDPADRVDEILERVDAHHDVAVEVPAVRFDRHAEKITDHRIGKLHAAQRVRAVDLGLTALDHRIRIAQHRHQPRALGRKVDAGRHDRVAARVRRERLVLVVVVVVDPEQHHVDAVAVKHFFGRRNVHDLPHHGVGERLLVRYHPLRDGTEEQADADQRAREHVRQHAAQQRARPWALGVSVSHRPLTIPFTS